MSKIVKNFGEILILHFTPCSLLYTAASTPLSTYYGLLTFRKDN